MAALRLVQPPFIMCFYSNVGFGAVCISKNRIQDILFCAYHVYWMLAIILSGLIVIFSLFNMTEGLYAAFVLATVFIIPIYGLIQMGSSRDLIPLFLLVSMTMFVPSLFIKMKFFEKELTHV